MHGHHDDSKVISKTTIRNCCAELMRFAFVRAAFRNLKDHFLLENHTSAKKFSSIAKRDSKVGFKLPWLISSCAFVTAQWKYRYCVNHFSKAFPFFDLNLSPLLPSSFPHSPLSLRDSLTLEIRLNRWTVFGSGLGLALFVRKKQSSAYWAN